MRKSLLNLSMALTLLISAASYSASTAIDPPPPPSPPPPPGLPIDNNLLILFTVALITGYYLTKKIYKTKTPN